MKPQGGFTLVEVLVAFTMLTMVVATVLSIFSQGLRVTAQMRDYGQAVRLAEAHLAGLHNAPALRPGSGSGRFLERFTWQREIDFSSANLSVMGEAGIGSQPMQVTLEVLWETHGRPMSLQLETLLPAEKR